MKLASIALAGVLVTGCTSKVELTDYTCLNSNCTAIGEELTGSQRPRRFLTKANHLRSDSVSYELRWRDTTTALARADPTKADLALVTYFEKTDGRSQVMWNLSGYNNVQDFTLTVRAPGYRASSVTWHVPQTSEAHLRKVKVNVASR